LQNKLEAPREQLAKLVRLLQSRKFPRDGPIFLQVLEFLQIRTQNFEIGEEERRALRKLMCDSFELTEEELQYEIVGASSGNGHSTTEDAGILEAVELEGQLSNLLPTRGFLRDYVDYTSHSEAPLAYHVFSALCGIGALLNRRVWINMGYYRVFPALGIIILGPSGIKKTSAANIIVDLLSTIGLVKIYSEKVTPEALVDAMKGDAVGLLYAPEMTVFLSKVKYMEGMV